MRGTPLRSEHLVRPAREALSSIYLISGMEMLLVLVLSRINMGLWASRWKAEKNYYHAARL